MTEISLVDTVDLGNLNVFLLKSGCSLFVVGGQRLTVTAPGGKELYENKRLGIDSGLEGGSGEAQNVRGVISEDEGEESKKGGGRRVPHLGGRT